MYKKGGWRQKGKGGWRAGGMHDDERGGPARARRRLPAVIFSMAVSSVTLRVSDIEKSVAFYVGTLRMQVVAEVVLPAAAAAEPSTRVCRVGWAGGVVVELVQELPAPDLQQEAPPGLSCAPDTKRDAWVWLGLGNFPDVAGTIAGLQQAGVASATLQGQFLDIGFVGHFSDPDGYMLEALQTTMEASFRPSPCTAPHNPLRAVAPMVAQLKLNVTDPQVSCIPIHSRTASSSLPVLSYLRQLLISAICIRFPRLMFLLGSGFFTA